MALLGYLKAQSRLIPRLLCVLTSGIWCLLNCVRYAVELSSAGPVQRQDSRAGTYHRPHDTSLHRRSTEARWPMPCTCAVFVYKFETDRLDRRHVWPVCPCRVKHERNHDKYIIDGLGHAAGHIDVHSVDTLLECGETGLPFGFACRRGCNIYTTPNTATESMCSYNPYIVCIVYPVGRDACCILSHMYIQTWTFG